MTLHDAKDRWDTVVVGGGVVGVGVFRDLCLHGEDALLIDARDFASQTSQSTSKLLHGGLRYLETLDLALVREALHEKSVLAGMFPHLVRERAFVVPVYRDSRNGLLMLRAGLFLYDLLSGFRNKPRRMLSPSEVAALFPGVRREGLLGGGLYHDAVMDDSRMALEALYDALARAPGNRALNHVRLKDLSPLRGGGYSCGLADGVTGDEGRVRCRRLVVAAGPFTDRLLGGFPFLRWRDRLLPSQGSHVRLRPGVLDAGAAMVMQTGGEDGGGGRVVFVVPGEGGVLVGTTEAEPPADPFDAAMGPGERRYLMDRLRRLFPGVRVGDGDVLSSFAGVRPLVADDGARKPAGRVSRRHRVYQPRSDVLVAVGGKYTTFRVMAGDVVRLLFGQKGRPYDPSLSQTPPLGRGVVASLAGAGGLSQGDLDRIVRTELPRTLDDLVVRRIGARTRAELPPGLPSLLRESPSVSLLHATEGMRRRWLGRD